MGGEHDLLSLDGHIQRRRVPPSRWEGAGGHRARPVVRTPRCRAATGRAPLAPVPFFTALPLGKGEGGRGSWGLLPCPRRRWSWPVAQARAPARARLPPRAPARAPAPGPRARRTCPAAPPRHHRPVRAGGRPHPRTEADADLPPRPESSAGPPGEIRIAGSGADTSAPRTPRRSRNDTASPPRGPPPNRPAGQSSRPPSGNVDAPCPRATGVPPARSERAVRHPDLGHVTAPRPPVRAARVPLATRGRGHGCWSAGTGSSIRLPLG